MLDYGVRVDDLSALRRAVPPDIVGLTLVWVSQRVDHW